MIASVIIDYIAIAFRWLTIVGRGLPTVSSKDLQSVSKRRIAVDCSGTANPLSFAHSVWRDPTDFNDLLIPLMNHAIFIVNVSMDAFVWTFGSSLSRSGSVSCV